MRISRLLTVSIALLATALGGAGLSAFAQPGPEGSAGPSPGFRMPPMPKPGPCPLPTLAALPSLEDASFYAVKEVPHGRVEAVFHKYGLRNFWVLSTGGHEWANWRRYLWQTAQIMFPEDAEE